MILCPLPHPQAILTARGTLIARTSRREEQSMAQQIEQAATREQRVKMTYEEFLAWADEDTHAEWVDGEVIVYMPPRLIHQDLMLFLGSLINRFARRLGLGKAVVAPFEMLIDSAKASRQPDVFFVLSEHLD